MLRGFINQSKDSRSVPESWGLTDEEEQPVGYVTEVDAISLYD